MSRNGNNGQVWVKAAIASGILLGIVLLVQTIATYFFVYDKIVRDQAAQEVARKEASLVKAAMSARITDAHRLSPLIEEMKREFPRQIAWVRIIDGDSQVLGQVGDPTTALPTADQLRQQLQMHQSRRTMIKSSRGDILVVDSRLRFFGHPSGPPPDNAAGPGPREMNLVFSEIAIYVDGVTVDFGALRQNLIIGCLAAIALLVSMLSIGLLFRRYIKARQLEQQLELARRVQTDLLPLSEGHDPSETLDFAAEFVPAATIGGDFYDVFTADNGRVSVLLGDVAGKGISAALLMGVLHGAIRSMRWTHSAEDQEEASRWLNRFLCEKTARERFVSLFWAYFDTESGLLHYVNAGHLPPFLMRAEGNQNTIERLEDGGPVLGLLPRAQYCSGSIRIGAGDVLIVFSDGVAEATNESDEEFGDVRIADTAKKHLGAGPREICDAILLEVNQFLGPLKPHDDQTLLVVRLVPAKKLESETELGNPVSLAS